LIRKTITTCIFTLFVHQFSAQILPHNHVYAPSDVLVSKTRNRTRSVQGIDTIKLRLTILRLLQQAKLFEDTNY